MSRGLEGRIDRKTFMIGNALGLSVLGFATFLIMVPTAIIDLAIAESHQSTHSVINLFYKLVIIPAAVYFIYFSVLFVRRLHDIGLPGLLPLIGFIVLVGASRKLDLFIVNMIWLLILVFLCVKPGTKHRNNYGPPLRKKFSLNNLKVTF
jgi:uncharacterized membrane protein YhaH (DUF805 family)